MLLYLELEDYLAQWFIHEQGGTVPVHVTRGSVESGLLELYLQTPPADYVPDGPGPGKVAVVLPQFKSKDTRDNFYLPPQARAALKACIRNRFDVVLWQSLHRFSSSFKRQDELIYAFMEKHGIENTAKNWDAVAKRYQRKRDYYLRSVRRKKSS